MPQRLHDRWKEIEAVTVWALGKALHLAAAKLDAQKRLIQREIDALLAKLPPPTAYGAPR